MVERQLKRRGIRDPRVLHAMSVVPREHFVPGELRFHAYDDRALSIGEGQTISQPWIVARMSELLALQGRERVLEVGTGSGYGAAVLSFCAGTVISIERVPALAERARARLAELGYDNVEVLEGDGSEGAPGQAPFGGISVTATAEGGLPAPLIEQLGRGAALVGPVRRESGEYLVRHRDGEEEVVVPVRFVPLIAGDPS